MTIRQAAAAGLVWGAAAAFLPAPGARASGPPTAAAIRSIGGFARIEGPGGHGRRATRPEVWSIDSLMSIGGRPVTVVGAPRLVETPEGRAVEFDGVGDGLFIEHNPLAGLGRFTLEVVFAPSPGGGEEQRFLHIEEAETGNRALVELRMLPGADYWCLDTFLRHGQASLTLIDRARRHQAGGWHAAALVYDGRTMTHFVNGVRELSGEVAFRPLGAGRTSIGVRQNRVSWFTGRIRLVRVTPEALPPAGLLKVVE